VDPGPGGFTRYAYRPFGEIASITDAQGNVTSWNYNARGFVIGTTDPDSGNWTYEVNAFGETTKIRDAKTQSPYFTTTFVYDKLSRLTSRTDVPESVTTSFVWGKASDNTASNKYIGRLKQAALPN
jgi:YD repeat-containing protein